MRLDRIVAGMDFSPPAIDGFHSLGPVGTVAMP